MDFLKIYKGSQGKKCLVLYDPSFNDKNRNIGSVLCFIHDKKIINIPSCLIDGNKMNYAYDANFYPNMLLKHNGDCIDIYDAIKLIRTSLHKYCNLPIPTGTGYTNRPPDEIYYTIIEVVLKCLDELLCLCNSINIIKKCVYVWPTLCNASCWLETLCEMEATKRLYELSVLKIQKAWRYVNTCPDNLICRNRLIFEFSELMAKPKS